MIYEWVFETTLKVSNEAEAFLSRRLFRRTNGRWFPRLKFLAPGSTSNQRWDQGCSAVEIFKFVLLRILFFFFFFVSLIYNRKINLLCLSISTIIIYNIFRTLFVRRYTYLWSVKIAKKKIIKILLKRMELYSHVAPPFHIFRNGIVTVLFDRSIKFSAPLGPTNYETLTRSFIDRWTFCYISFAAFFLYTDINDNLLEIDNSSAL